MTGLSAKLIVIEVPCPGCHHVVTLTNGVLSVHGAIPGGRCERAATPLTPGERVNRQVRFYAATNGVAGLSEALARMDLPCRGGACDGGLPITAASYCFRHRNLYSIAARLIARRLGGY